jgi:hypothetical protein
MRGGANANPPFRRAVSKDEWSPSPELDPDEVIPVSNFISRSQLKEQISWLTGQLEGFKVYAKTQQVVMER